MNLNLCAQIQMHVWLMITGPAILSFMMVGGAVIASISAFSAILVAVFIVPAAIALIFAFGSVAGGLALGASTIAIGFGAVALVVSSIAEFSGFVNYVQQPSPKDFLFLMFPSLVLTDYCPLHTCTCPMFG